MQSSHHLKAEEFVYHLILLLSFPQ
uniref:Uncharacterized protein n=1 Tax=Rhizophora mucronata TaxID=61149 RepID=A0A2P2LNV0_RHIMU